MDHYDEELCDNSFFQTIQHSFSNILDLVSVSGWMILVPCKNSLQGVDLTLDSIESHVVKAQEDDPNEFYTLNKKELLIKSGIISTGKGFDLHRQVKVLFEELFYNNEGGSYRVLCIAGPLQGGASNEGQSKDVDGELLKSKKAKIELSQLNFEDSCFHLWGYPGGSRTKHYLMKMVDQLARELSSGRDISLEETIEIVRKTFELLVKFLVRTAPFKKPTSHYGMYLALETFMMHRVHRQLMRLIGVHAKDSDFKLNKSTRNLTSHLALEHLGVHMVDTSSLDRSRIVLNNFVRRITPSAKIYQLRKLFYSLLYSVPTVDGNFMAMTSSELIPLCSYLLVKSSSVNNWWCHLLLMRNFCFSISHFDQELEYFLSTLEASMMFVMSEKINPLDVWSDRILATEFPVDETIPPVVITLFQHVTENNLVGLEDLKRKLENLKRDGDPTEMCHPLCSCSCCSGRNSLDGIRSVQQALKFHNEAGFTALQVACILGHHDVADWLLDNGSNADEKSHHGHRPLHLACSLGFQVLVLLLLSHGADIRSTDENDNNALHVASFHGHLQCVKALIFVDQASRKLDLDAVNSSLDTPLHVAARWGYEDICICLLESGASGLKKNKQHLLPSDLAPSLHLCNLISKAVEDESRMEATIKRKLSLTIKSDRTALARRSLPAFDESNLALSFSESSLSSPISSSFSSSASSKTSQARRVKRLGAASPLALGKSHASSDSGEKHDKMNRPVDDVVKDKHDFTGGENPLQHGKHSRSKNLHNFTATDDDDIVNDQIELLLKACKDGNVNEVKSLLHWYEYEQNNPEVTLLDVTKAKLCHPLCQCSKCIHVQLLSPTDQTAEQKVNVNATSSEGLSPLHVACKNGRLELVRLLLMRGALVDGGGETAGGCPTPRHLPLHLACQQPCHQVVRLLIQYGADLNAVDGAGNTALHLCSLHRFFKHALLLLLSNVVVNVENAAGHTPLYSALRSSDVNMVFLLLLFGADVDGSSNLRLTAQARRALEESALVVKSLNKFKSLQCQSTSNFVESLGLDGLGSEKRKESLRSTMKCGLVESLRCVQDDNDLIQSSEVSRRLDLMIEHKALQF